MSIGLAQGPLPFVVFALSLATLFAALVGLWRVSRSRALPGGQGARLFLIAGGALAAWYGLAVRLGLLGVFRVDPSVYRPVNPLAALLPVLAGSLILPRIGPFRQLFAALPHGGIIALHVLRLGFGVAFLVALGQGRLPSQWALPVGLGDIVIGGLAPLVALAVARQAPGWRGLALIWNFAGLLDFLDAVVLVNLAQTTPIQRLFFTPSLNLIGEFPQSLLPAFVVPLFVLLHLFSLYRLLRQPRPAAQPRLVGANR